MATTYTEAQVQGTASTSTYATLYSTDATTTAIIGTLGICNTAAAGATYRIAVMDTEGTPGAADWKVYDASVSPNDTAFMTIGLTVGPNRFVRVSSSANTVTFFASVSEIS